MPIMIRVYWKQVFAFPYPPMSGGVSGVVLEPATESGTVCVYIDRGVEKRLGVVFKLI